MPWLADLKIACISDRVWWDSFDCVNRSFSYWCASNSWLSFSISWLVSTWFHEGVGPIDLQVLSGFLISLKFGLLFSSSTYFRFQYSALLLSSLTIAFCLTILARWANFNVERVSLIALMWGFRVQIIKVFAFPPKESLSR